MIPTNRSTPFDRPNVIRPLTLILGSSICVRRKRKESYSFGNEITNQQTNMTTYRLELRCDGSGKDGSTIQVHTGQKDQMCPQNEIVTASVGTPAAAHRGSVVCKTRLRLTLDRRNQRAVIGVARRVHRQTHCSR
jgi:hypothetical protein